MKGHTAAQCVTKHNCEVPAASDRRIDFQPIGRNNIGKDSTVVRRRAQRMWRARTRAPDPSEERVHEEYARPPATPEHREADVMRPVLRSGEGASESTCRKTTYVAAKPLLMKHPTQTALIQDVADVMTRMQKRQHSSEHKAGCCRIAILPAEQRRGARRRRHTRGR